MWQTWLIIAGITFVLEMFTAGFLVFWFGISALFVMLLSFFISDLIIQTTIFIILSIILILSTRPLVNKFIATKTVKTNVFSLVGKKAQVIKELNPIEGKGQIKVNGEVWSAEEIHGETVPVGTEVEINEISGVKAIVSVLRLPNNT